MWLFCISTQLAVVALLEHHLIISEDSYISSLRSREKEDVNGVCWPLSGQLRFLEVIEVTTIAADRKSKETRPSTKQRFHWGSFMFPSLGKHSCAFHSGIVAALTVRKTKWWSVRASSPVCQEGSVTLGFSFSVCLVCFFLTFFCSIVFPCAPLPSCIKRPCLLLSYVRSLIYLVCRIWVCPHCP